MKVVIVGGGFGGVKTAYELMNQPGIEVVLISEGTNFEYHGALYRTGTGRSPLEVAIPLRDIFERAQNVQLVLDRVVSLDAAKRRVVSETGNLYPYDQLVLAMGNQVNYFDIPGMDEHSHTMITVSQTIALRHELVRLFRSKRKTARIAIVGAGPTGVELAGELSSFADMVEAKYGHKPKYLDITLIEAADRALPMLQPKASRKVEKRLQKLGVRLMLKTSVNACRPGTLCLADQDIEADLIIWTAGSRAVDFYRSHHKLFQFERGRVKVDEYLRAVGHDNIYVIGDNAATRFSGMAQTALHDAGYVARNFVRIVRDEEPVRYRTRHPIYVVPVGPRWAVVQTQGGIMSGYRGWVVRRRADLWIYKNFAPYKKALKTWRQGNRIAQF